MKNLIIITIFSAWAVTLCYRLPDNSVELPINSDIFYTRLADSALSLVDPSVVYDPSYISIDYPNGDVPNKTGVCTDVVIRSYRKVGIDLQKGVNEDMSKNFSLYPKRWGLKKADPNIDHRRVPNLMTYFERNNAEIEITKESKDYLPGDIVCWKLSNGLLHIGLVTNKTNWKGNQYKIIHNIGSGQILQDCLFDFEIVGHYRFKI